MFKRKWQSVIIVLLLMVVIVAAYQVQQYRERSAAKAFFNYGQSAALKDEKEFFDYGVEQKAPGSNHDL